MVKMVNGFIGCRPNVGFEEEILVNRIRITIKINIAKYCIALTHPQILNYQPNR